MWSVGKCPHCCSVSVLIILVLHLAVRTHATNCTLQQNNQMQRRFTECTGKVTMAYQQSIEEGTKEGATCTLFTDLINDCGKVWETCHSQEDISKMKDMQLEALLGQYVDSGIVHLEDCPIVNEYWSVEGVEEEHSDSEKCSDRQYIQTQTKFQTCSHEISSQAYNSFQEISEPRKIEEAVCDSLKNISTACPPLLQVCFVDADIRQIVRMHLQEIQGYLISLSTLRINISAVDTCEAHDKFKEHDVFYEEQKNMENTEEYHEDKAEVSQDEFTEVEPAFEQVDAHVVDAHEAAVEEVEEEAEKDLDITGSDHDVRIDISNEFPEDIDIPFENIASLEASTVSSSARMDHLALSLISSILLVCR